MSRYEIKKWMLLNIDRFIDKKTNEVDMTRMVESWDFETQDGGQTTDPDHIAWKIAFDVAEKIEKDND